MTPHPRKSKPSPIFVAPLPETRGALSVAENLAAEWANPPFFPEIASDSLECWRIRKEDAVILIAMRNGDEAGMLCGKIRDSIAVAPLVWARATVSTTDRDAATTALTRAFLEWAQERQVKSAQLVFRPGLAPGTETLTQLGLLRMFDVCIRNAILPDDEIAGPPSGSVNSDDVEKWRAEAAKTGDDDWVEKKIRERFGWSQMRGKSAPQPATALSSTDLAQAAALARDARKARGAAHNSEAFLRTGRRRNSCILGTEIDGKLRGVLGGGLESHPHSAGALAVAAWMETMTAGMKSPRQVQDSLALGFARWAEKTAGADGVRTLCFVLPSEGAYWSSFRERWHLQLAGNGYGRELESPENGL